MTRTLTRGAQTRERLLDIAETAVLQKGFGATSIDELIFEAGLTKGGFFYHFRDKNELAKALLERFTERDGAIFDDIFARARELSEDPLHSFLIALKLTAEVMSDLPGGHPGCIVAAVAYHERQFDPDVRRVTAETMLTWRTRFQAELEAIAAKYPPRIDIDMGVLADMFSCVVDGAIILGKGLGEADALPKQILAYRAFVRSVFLGA